MRAGPPAASNVGRRNNVRSILLASDSIAKRASRFVVD